LETQRQVFEHILRASARAGGKVLTIHSVRATRAVLDLIESHLTASSSKAVLHWFTGTKAEARRAADLGCYFSINSEMLNRERQSAIVAALPIDRLLTETDGPFVQVAGRPVKPSDVVKTVAALARIRAVDDIEMARTIRENLKRLVAD
jgi:TatD DNase family protein